MVTKKYLIDGEEFNESDFNNNLEDDVNRQAEDNYDEILDETYGTVTIAGVECDTSYALYKTDPIAYRCGLSDEQSYRLGEAQDELENGEEVKVNGHTYQIIENEEEEEEEE